MRHVQVATKDDRLLLVKAHEIGTEIVLPRHAIVQTAQSVLRVGRIAAHQEEIWHLECDDTPLMIVLVDTDAIGNAERLVLRIFSASSLQVSP